jgi:hypothetical protein
VIFANVALLHFLRLLLDWPAQIGSWSVPYWLSWVSIFVAGGLCLWAFQLMASKPAR